MCDFMYIFSRCVSRTKFPAISRYREQALSCEIPCLSIQPLVENAIVHGLEPKKGKGHLIIQIIEGDDQMLEICIIDDGIGFEVIPDIQSIRHSEKDSTLTSAEKPGQAAETAYGS